MKGGGGEGREGEGRVINEEREGRGEREGSEAGEYALNVVDTCVLYSQK